MLPQGNNLQTFYYVNVFLRTFKRSHKCNNDSNLKYNWLKMTKNTQTDYSTVVIITDTGKIEVCVKAAKDLLFSN